jgi:ABC-2 type transport system permease protein
MAMSVTLTAMLVAAPVIDVMAFARGVHWLIAYAGIAVIGMMATAMAATVVSALFAAIGPRRTRLVAQVVAALIGAAFVIGIQVAAIMSYGSPSRGGFIRSELVMRHAPAPDSLFWWPARAILNGDVPSMAAFVALGAALLGVVILVLAPGFAARVTTASGEARSVSRRRRTAGFHIQSPARALRRKEWTLLLRDPWLVSQSLMQLLYLVVPAVLLWRSLGAGLDARALLVPVLIMTAGQLAGGLTWITVSGEDAPDLIASAPIRDAAVLRAKLEAVMGAVAIIFSPFLVVFALLSPFEAVVAAMGVAISAACATAVQLWFRAQARRSNFRRRQQSSRVATFAEAFSSISWAFAGVMAAGQAWLAASILSAMALAVLAGTWRISPAASRAS